MTTTRKLAFAVLAASLILFLIEGALSFVRAIRSVTSVALMEEEKHTAYDEGLGWVNLSNFHSPDLYGPGRSYSTNGQGFRSVDGDFNSEVPAGRYRIICLGDSFTMGYGVADGDTFPSQIEELVPTSEVVNMGMGGYGIGQDYLWYQRERERLPASLLLFAFIPNDFQRLASSKFLGYSKPRVVLREGGLVTENVPVPRGWNKRLWAERSENFAEKLAIAALIRKLASFANRPPPAYQSASIEEFAPTAEKIFQELAAISRDANQQFALVSLATNRERGSELGAWLHDFSKRSGIHLIDVAEAFAPLSDRERESLYLRGNSHYSAEGNRRVAQVIAAAAGDFVPGFPPTKE